MASIVSIILLVASIAMQPSSANDAFAFGSSSTSMTHPTKSTLLRLQRHPSTTKKSAYHAKPNPERAKRFVFIDPFQSSMDEAKKVDAATSLQLNGKSGREALLQTIFKQATSDAQFREAETLEQEQTNGNKMEAPETTRHLPDMDPLADIRLRKKKTGKSAT
jgi:hypothetical protein